MISHEQREHVQLAILQALDSIHPRSMSAHTLLTPLKASGLVLIERPDVESVLADMSEQGFVKLVESPLASEIKRFTRTDKGRALLREQGL